MIQLPLISVIMPVFNSEKFLKEAVNAIMQQTFQSFELIAIDDGSSDNSVQILKTIESQDDRLKVLQNDHRGAAEARNLGIERAKGDFICFVDSDDLFHKDMLSEFYSKAVLSNADIVICGYRKFDNETNKKIWDFIPDKKYLQKQRLRKEEYLNEWFMVVPPSPWGKFIKKELIIKNNIRFQNLTSCNDFSFSYTLLSCANTLAAIKWKLLFYRANNGISISSDRGSKAENIVYAIENLKSNLKLLGNYDELKNTFLERSAITCAWELKHCSSQKRNEILDLIKRRLDQEFIEYLQPLI